MFRKLVYLLFVPLLALPVAAEEIYLGKVEIVNPDYFLRITIDPADRVNLRPAEKVLFKTPIPGLDEMAVSAVGYVWFRENGKIVAKADGGEGTPQIGDTVFLQRGTYASMKREAWADLSVAEYNEEVPNYWADLDDQDLEVGVQEGFIGAQCGQAEKLVKGEGASDEVKLEAVKIYQDASEKWKLTHRCARNYAKLLKELKLEGIEKWAKVAAESGRSTDIFFYADLLTEKKEYDKAKVVLHKFLGTNPENSKYGAERRLKEIEEKENGPVAKDAISSFSCKGKDPLACAEALVKLK